MTIKIITNNVPRLLEDAVPPWGSQEEAFFTYKGEQYFLSEAEYLSPQGDFPNWDGIYRQSYDSGVLVRLLPDDPDYVIVGRYYCYSDFLDETNGE